MSKAKGEGTSFGDLVTAGVTLGAPRTRPMPAPTQLFQMTEDHRRVVEELERLKNSGGSARNILLTDLVVSGYHSAPMVESRVLALIENLKSNPLSSPLVVRQVDGGKYEILAGRHRREAFSRLGREEIPCVVATFDDDAAERVVFFDNLFAPTLSDFEKYLGFAKRKESKKYTNVQLAEEAGLSTSQVSRLLSFEKLPDETKLALRAKPEAVPANLAEALVRELPQKAELVREGVQRLIEGRISAATLLRELQGAPGRKAAAAARVAVKSGKRVFAEMVTKDQSLTVRLRNLDDVARTEKAILEALERLATS